MLLWPKQTRIRDRKHLDWLRELPCVKCFTLFPVPENIEFVQFIGAEASHIRLKSNSGVALKPCDSAALPLCHVHHMKSHRGESTFWGDKLDNAITLAKSLYEVTGQRDKAIELIKGAGL